MTLLAAWVGADDKPGGKAISSLYFASDSRYSWGPYRHYDVGCKVFASKTFPEIFGFCGDVYFPLHAIAVVMCKIDSDLLFDETDTFATKHEKVLKEFGSLFQDYPCKNKFTIIHGTRVNGEFRLYQYTCDNPEQPELQCSEIPLYNPDKSPVQFKSTLVFKGGSGTDDFHERWLGCDHDKDNNYNTSRQVFHCIAESIADNVDIRTGGHPQIVGLYRGLSPRVFGVIANGRRYLYGREITGSEKLDNVEWRNENFEIVDPSTLRRKPGAQAQPFPPQKTE